MAIFAIMIKLSETLLETQLTKYNGLKTKMQCSRCEPFSGFRVPRFAAPAPLPSPTSFVQALLRVKFGADEDVTHLAYLVGEFLGMKPRPDAMIEACRSGSSATTLNWIAEHLWWLCPNWLTISCRVGGAGHPHVLHWMEERASDTSPLSTAAQLVVSFKLRGASRELMHSVTQKIDSYQMSTEPFKLLDACDPGLPLGSLEWIHSHQELMILRADMNT